MATRKKKAKAKAKSKVKRKKIPVKKQARNKTAAKSRQPPPKKKSAAPRESGKKKTNPVRRPAAKLQPTPAPVPAVPVGERVGVVTHYFSHLAVVVVKLERGTLRVGDTIRFKGHTSDFSQRIGSLQVNHQSVTEVGPNDDFGMKVTDHTREGDVVYKV
jgi:Elongation factor Tu domain 2